MAKSTGTVKFFNKQKGFGFITPDTGGKDLFVHANSLGDEIDFLSDGQRVEFEVEQARKGPEAKNIRVL